MPPARWTSFAPDTPTWQIVARCVAGGLIAGIIFGAVGALTDSSSVFGGIFFAIVMAVFFTVVNLRQMRRGPWEPEA